MSVQQIHHTAWLEIADEQRRRDQLIRLCQAATRQAEDEKLKASGRRMWVSGSTSSLPVKNIPDLFEDAFGYPGQARLVGFYLGAGEEAYFYDGRGDMAAGEVDAFLLFVRHRSVAPCLRGFHFGSSEEGARHWLLLDREKRQLTVAPAQLARVMVESQWGTPEVEQVMIVDDGQWALLVSEVQAMIEGMHPDLVALEIQQQQRLLALLEWLEGRRNK
jgi:hypothetical protein